MSQRFLAKGNLNSPALIFLHGFCGAKEDWEEWIDALSSDFFCLALDLTCLTHQFCQEFFTLFSSLGLKEVILIGYSMGGRVALQFAEKHPDMCQAVIAISAHTGLTTEKERQKRWESDLKWIELLESQPIVSFINKWYAQPLFSSLKKNEPLFERVCKRRLKSDPYALARSLRTFSLSHQLPITHFHPHTLFLYGKEDWKYANIYSTLPCYVTVQEIDGAGHAVHLENPKGCIKIIKHWLGVQYANTRSDTNS